MRSAPVPFEPGASLARVDRTPTGYVIDTRGPRSARHYDCDCAHCAAELAVVLRDEGGWRLRFSPAAEAVRAIVEEIDGEARS